jgi:4-carboxymuconolactone decarboxylase
MIHDQQMYEAGLAMRRQVLGDRYVDPQLEAAKDDPAWQAIQDAATELAWGHVWTRPGLDLKVRSMINLAMLTALGKMPELRTHVRGALRNGVTQDEIIEVLLQATIYCGFPAGIDAFRNARDVLKEEAV